MLESGDWGVAAGRGEVNRLDGVRLNRLDYHSLNPGVARRRWLDRQATGGIGKMCYQE